MALLETIKALNEVDETLQQYYVKSGDAFVLDIDNSGTTARIGEFRNNNINLNNKNTELLAQLEAMKDLQTQLTDMRSKFKDIDPASAREAMKTAKSIADKKLIDAGKVDELVATRGREVAQAEYAPVIEDLNTQIAKIETELKASNQKTETYEQRLSTLVVDNALQKAVTNVANVRKGAMRDILGRGRDIYVLDDSGNPVPRDAVTGNTILGKDGEKPLGMEDWASQLVLDAPYLFEGSAGGGAGGGDNSGNNGGGSGSVVKGQVQLDDQQAINSNIEDIAKGTITVVD